MEFWRPAFLNTCQPEGRNYHKGRMKKLLALAALAVCFGLHQTALAQADSASIITSFLDQAKAASDTKLGDIASQLTGKIQKLESVLGTNSLITDKLDSTLKSLTGGQDSAALTSAYDLVKGAKPTAEQLNLAKQVGNLASAYVVQKNFASLEGSESDVATIVKSLRDGKITAAVPSLKNVASSAKLTDTQKELIKTVADKYAPGWEKAKGAMDSLKKLPGF
jgi:hypothetical protein